MIREATKQDIPKIIEMVEEMCLELGEETSRAHVCNIVVLSYRIAPCFLVLKDGNIVGMAGLYVKFLPFSGQATLSDYGFYIHPRHRSYNLFSGLIDKCKQYANEVNLPLYLNLQAKVSNDFKEKLFKRKGFNPSSMIGVYNG